MASNANQESSKSFKLTTARTPMTSLNNTPKPASTPKKTSSLGSYLDWAALTSGRYRYHPPWKEQMLRNCWNEFTDATTPMSGARCTAYLMGQLRRDHLLNRTRNAVERSIQYFISPSIRDTDKYLDGDHVMRFMVQFAVAVKRKDDNKLRSSVPVCLKEALDELEWLVGKEELAYKEWAIERAKADEEEKKLDQENGRMLAPQPSTLDMQDVTMTDTQATEPVKSSSVSPVISGSVTVFGLSYDLSSPEVLEQFINDLDSAELLMRWRWAGKWREQASEPTGTP